MKTRISLVNKDTDVIKERQEEQSKRESAIDAMFEGMGKVSNIHKGKQISMIPVSKIVPDPENARDKYDEVKLNELADSIRELGIKQPIMVEEMKPGEYQIVFGERRWRAAISIGLDVVPAMVEHNLSKEDRMFWGLVENVQREQLTEVQKARQIMLIKRKFPDMTFEAIGKRMGYKKARISQLLSISKLPAEIQELIEGVENINVRHIRAICLVADISIEEAMRLVDQITLNGYSGDEALNRAKEIIKRIDNKPTRVKTNISGIITRLRNRLDKLDESWKDLSANRRALYKNELIELSEQIRMIVEK